MIDFSLFHEACCSQPNFSFSLPFWVIRLLESLSHISRSASSSLWSGKFLLESTFGVEKQRFVDVGENTAASDCRLDKCVQFFVTSDRNLQVSWGDSLFLEIFTSMACEFDHFSCEVFQDGCRVYRWSCSDALLSNRPDLHEAVDSTNGELESGPLRPRLWIGSIIWFSFTTFSWHFLVCFRQLLLNSYL